MASLDTFNFFPEDEEDNQTPTNNSTGTKGENIKLENFINSVFPDEEEDFYISREQMQQEQRQEEAKQKEEENINKQLEIEEEKSWVDLMQEDVGKAVVTGEVFKAPFAGVEKAINETADFIGDIGNWMEETTGFGRFVWDREGRFSFLPSYWSRKEVKEGLANGKLKLDDTIIDTIENLDMISDDFNTVSGTVVEGISRLAVGMIGAGKFMGFKRGEKGLKNLRNTVASAGVADMVVFDPEMDNLSAWLTQNGWAEGTFAEYLATDMTDSKFKNRLRNLGEGIVIGVPLELLFRAGKLAKLKQKAQAEPTNKVTLSEIDRVEDETIKIMSNNPPAKTVTKPSTEKKISRKKNWFGGEVQIDLETIKTKTREERESIRQNASNIANKTKVGQRDKIKLAKEFQDSINKDLSPDMQIKIVKNNKIDEQAYRNAGNQLLKDPDRIDQIVNNMELVEKAQGRQGHLVAWSKGERRLREDEAVSPFLNAEALDGFTALVSNFRKMSTDESYKGKFKWDNKKKHIDNIFDMGITQEMDGQLLLKTLHKSGLTFNQFILATIGSASEAGKVLQKFSRITDPAKLKGTKGKEFDDMLDKEEAINSFWLRMENVRRGAMVSSIPTAARNLTSAMIRLPAEGLGNMVDTIIYDMSKGGIRSGVSSAFSSTKWKDSFASWSLLTAKDLKQLDAFFFSKEFKGMEKWHKKLYGQVNEIRRLTGRKEGEAIGRGEAAIQKVENLVDWLNIPNRAQEFLVRRSVFFGEMQRLMRREWNLDFWKALEDGQLRSMMNNVDTVRPSKNSKTFEEILEDASTRALDVTYAKQADSQVGRDFTTFITRNGLTVLVPFPRFMMNSIELMLQYGGGASIPLTRKVKDFVVGNKTRPLTDRDRMLISRNIVGVAATMAAYQYRMGSDSEDYKKMDVNDTAVADVTPQFPLRQYLFVGEAIKRFDSGQLGDWFNWKEFVETFGGTNVRAGQGHSVLEGLANIANSSGVKDALTEERVAKILGEAVGNYIGSWSIPIAQLSDLQRAVGLRSDAVKDYREQERLIEGGWERFKEEATYPLRRRGIFNLFTPSGEKSLPNREYIYSEGETRERKYPWAKSLLGLNIVERDSKEGRLLADYGLLEWVHDSNTDIPSVQNTHNKLMRELLPVLTEAIEIREGQVLKDYEQRKKEWEEQGKNMDIFPSSENAMKDEIRSYAKEQLQLLRNGTRTTALEEKQKVAAIFDLTIQFKKLTTAQRKNSLNRFIYKYGIEPDYTNIKHLDDLITLGKLKLK